MVIKTVKLGGTDASVSIFCLGTMYFGSKINRERSFSVLDQYMDAGGSFLDTSNNYAHWVGGCAGGESESLLGDWLKQRNVRSRVFLASKVGFQMPGVKRGLSSKQIEEECNKSLKRLGVDTIDLYYAHVDDRNTPMEETLEALNRLIQAGKIRYIGASNYMAWRMEEAHWISQTNDWAEFCCIQQRYTYLRPKAGAVFYPQVAANEDLLDYCRNRKLTMLAYSPLLGGAYERRDKSFPEQYVGPHNDSRLDALNAVADEKGATVNQIILAWMLHSNPIVLPLVAASSKEQLGENLAALEIHLTSGDMDRLK